MSRRSAEGLMVLVTFLAAAGWVFTKESLAAARVARTIPAMPLATWQLGVG